jgi:amidophosphoribosyltransferase
MLRKAGAREVHMRVTSPPITHPCFYGIDMGTRWELVAAQKASVEEIREHIGADSLGFLSQEGLEAATSVPKSKLCMACFSGEYPTPVPLQMDKLSLEPAQGALDRHELEYLPR